VKKVVVAILIVMANPCSRMATRSDPHAASGIARVASSPPRAFEPREDGGQRPSGPGSQLRQRESGTPAGEQHPVGFIETSNPCLQVVGGGEALGGVQGCRREPRQLQPGIAIAGGKLGDTIRNSRCPRDRATRWRR
jgi:hypothetical protein